MDTCGAPEAGLLIGVGVIIIDGATGKGGSFEGWYGTCGEKRAKTKSQFHGREI